ncbi:MAG: hypothetical protein COY81_02570 [Candidatus Pacebacteria bacterium CG_4_10_14_0_8_um_filter_43_12]|nr:MAG: hypothetical protein COU66_00030 [Candidatus Pacebacteria bacterium CG10_big_fil_rev_8_21_14_0_10_44_11]PIY79425.1 MAG: hypothetical protein COY81_02570 [Candidatus Pacebacteria bacterium CG_4_10_14_0_8_um_filter_43_12]
MKYVVSAFIFHQQKLLIVHHKKLKIWLPVGGHVEEDETFEEALHREVKEEVNLHIKILNAYPTFEKLATSHIPLYVHSGMESNTMKVWFDFVCSCSSTKSFELQTTELDNFKWIKKSDVNNLESYPLVKKLAKSAFDFIFKK